MKHEARLRALEQADRTAGITVVHVDDAWPPEPKAAEIRAAGAPPGALVVVIRHFDGLPDPATG